MFTSGGTAAWMSYAISGATTDAANDNRGIQMQSTGGQRIGGTFFHCAILTARDKYLHSEVQSVNKRYRNVVRYDGLMVIPM